MENIEWKFIKPLLEDGIIEKYLCTVNVTLPNKLVELLKTFNGGRPNKKEFNTDKNNGYIFKCLLSYNKEDIENIYKYYNKSFKLKKLYPIGTDCAGNFICYNLNTNDYILLNHENDVIEKILL